MEIFLRFLVIMISLISCFNTQSTNSILYSPEWVQIKNLQTGRCLRYIAKDAPVELTDCFNIFETVFKVEDLGGNLHSITTYLGFTLDNKEGKTESDNPILTCTQHQGENQKFSFSDLDTNGNIQIKVKISGKCLHIANDTPGTILVQRDCLEKDNAQLFSFSRPSNIAPLDALKLNEYVTIKNKKSGKCINIDKYKSNSQAIQFPCLNKTKDSWILSFNQIRGTYVIASMIGDHVLDNENSGNNDNNKILYHTRHEGLNQNFAISPFEETGYFRIVVVGSNKCVSAEEATDGSGITQVRCNLKSENQQWIIEASSNQQAKAATLPENSWVNIVSSKGLCVRSKGQEQQLELATCDSKDEFLFNISFESSEGIYYIINKGSNLYLDNSQGSKDDKNPIIASGGNGSTSKQWYVREMSSKDSNYLNIIAWDSIKCLTSEGNSENSKLYQLSCSDDDLQKFSVKNVAEVNTPEFNFPNYVILENKKTKLCIRSGIAPDYKALVTECNDSDFYSFSISYDSTKSKYQFRSRHFRLNLDVPGSSSELNVELITYDVSLGSNQYFNLRKTSDTDFRIVTNTDKNLCASVDKSGTSAGLIQVECSDSDDNQVFKAKDYKVKSLDLEGSFYQLENKKTKLCTHAILPEESTAVKIDNCKPTDEFIFGLNWRPRFNLYQFGNVKLRNYFGNTANNNILELVRAAGHKMDFQLDKIEGDHYRISNSTNCLTSRDDKTNFHPCVKDDETQIWKFKRMDQIRVEVSGYIYDSVNKTNLNKEALEKAGFKLTFTSNGDDAKKYEAKIDENGRYYLYIPHGNYKINLSLKGYASLSENKEINSNISDYQLSIIPKEEGIDYLKIVLDYSKSNHTLSVFVVREGTHDYVFYDNVLSKDNNVNLLHDEDTKIQIITISDKTDSTYRYYVYNNSNLKSLSDEKNVNVNVIKNGKENINTFNSPKKPEVYDDNLRAWHVLNVRNGEIEEVNELKYWFN